MAKTAYINARIDEQLKARAQKVLHDVGLTTTEAVTLLMHQVVLHGGLPFEVRIPNKETQEAIRESRAGKVRRHTGTSKEILREIIESDDFDNVQN